MISAGVQFFPSADSIGPAEFAAAAEDRGFESVFFPDHTHVPVGGGVPGWSSGADLPEYYRTLLELVVVLAAAVAVTTRIRVGSAVCLVPQRDPIILAKQVATLDQLSHGRMVLGVGAGSNPEELHNHGTHPDRRFAVLRERIEAMTAIWAQPEAAYHGEFVRFRSLWSWPKPVQRPRPPILLGGSGPRVLDRVVAYADGWMPFREGTQQITDHPSGEIEDFEAGLAARIRALRDKASAAGRPHLPVTLFNACPHPAALERYRAMGIERVVFWLPTQDATATLRTLDELTPLVGK
ncbi:LLM class F420-dependent oxidoreductase [Nocardia jiangxiensis]|uniref:LLM class F420-dependent oxidoreductase n=1 Tax=Nocardia jiangxiensis TaxID=282685 RepID=A0ABW6RYT5_9NOCA